MELYGYEFLKISLSIYMALTFSSIKWGGLTPSIKRFILYVFGGWALLFCILLVFFVLYQPLGGGQSHSFYRDMCVKEKNDDFLFPNLIVFAVRYISNRMYVWSYLCKYFTGRHTCFNTSIDEELGGMSKRPTLLLYKIRDPWMYWCILMYLKYIIYNLKFSCIYFVSR